MNVTYDGLLAVLPPCCRLNLEYVGATILSGFGRSLKGRCEDAECYTSPSGSNAIRLVFDACLVWAYIVRGMTYLHVAHHWVSVPVQVVLVLET